MASELVKTLAKEMSVLLHTCSTGTEISLGALGNCVVKGFARGNVKAIDVGPYRFLTQNPEKDSQWGKLARAGHKVVWIIHQPDNRWMYRLVDDELTQL